MLQLNPRENFTIVRQLQNPYITDTFYVRAVIRNAKTDAIIATIDLTDRTGQRFSKVWNTPADASGAGFFISIVTSVYDDSGYTTKSQNYGDEENTYLVQQRYVFNPNYPLGGAGDGAGANQGPDISYARIRKIMREELERIVEKLNPHPVVSTKEIVREFQVPDVRIVEKFRDLDTGPILKAIAIVGKKVDDKPVTEVPEQEEVDLKPVLDEIKNVKKEVKNGFSDTGEKIKGLKVRVEITNPVQEMSVSESKPEPKEDLRVKKLIKQTS